MIRVGPYSQGDADSFLRLYRACLNYYGVGTPDPEQEQKILALLNRQRHMSCLLAWDDDCAVGFATWTLTFPAGTGTALYLKELFVNPAAHRKGVGRTLLAGLLDIAVTEGCTRIDWQTDGTHGVSQAFYSKINAPRFEKVTYRIDAGDFETFRSRLQSG